jgi:hypothetical protein
MERPSFVAERDSVAEAIDRASKNGAGSFPTYMTIGNHEARTLRWGRKYHTIGDLLYNQIIGVFDEAGWDLTGFGEYLDLEGVKFTHIPLTAMGRPIGGKTADNRILNASGGSVVHGHTHAFTTKAAAKITGELHRVVSLPCFLPQGHKEHYMKHSPADWDYGVVTMTLHDGQILSIAKISMAELEACYG